MLKDARILEIYIESMIRLMGEAEYISKRETDILHKTNMFNRKSNLEAIRHEYKKYYDKVDKEWSQIYSGSKEFLETKNFFNSLSLQNSLYATTFPQKLVEQFYHQLSFLTEICIESNSPERKEKRTESDFFNDFFFGSLQTAIENLFPVVIIAIVNHSVNIDDKKKKAFLEINKKYVQNVSIPYRAGDMDKIFMLHIAFLLKKMNLIINCLMNWISIVLYLQVVLLSIWQKNHWLQP